jgi:hypothetical protein
MTLQKAKLYARAISTGSKTQQSRLIGCYSAIRSHAAILDMRPYFSAVTQASQTNVKQGCIVKAGAQANIEAAT